MAVICQRMVTLLQICTDLIDITPNFYLMPNASHLEHIQHCYEVINPKVKFLPHGDSELAYIFTVKISFLIGDTLMVQKNIGLQGCWVGVGG